MDFATISQLVQANGYKKVNTQSSLVTYNTTFLKEDRRVEVNWVLGGYVSSIIIGGSDGAKIIYDSAQEFIESFS